MKRRLMKLLGVGSCLALLAGCAPMNSEQVTDTGGTENPTVVSDWQSKVEELKEVKPAELPEHLTLKISDTLQIDAEIAVSKEVEEYQVAELKLTPHLFEVDIDIDRLLGLLGNPEVIEREERTSDELLADQETFLQVRMAYLQDGNFVQVRDNRFLVVRTLNTIYEMVDMGGYYRDLFGISEDMANRRYQENGELDFMTAQEAEDVAHTFLAEMGVKDLCSLRCFACDRENLQEEVTARIETMQLVGLEQSEIDAIDSTVEKKDEGYYLVAQQGYQGIPYYPTNADMSVSNNFTEIGTSIELTVTEAGILSAEVTGLYEPAATGEKLGILSLGEILDTFIARNNDENAVGPSTVRYIGLFYLPVLEDKEGMRFDALPVYCVMYDQIRETATGYCTREYNVFDAATGERLI
ncbi:MAG: hypothetical protein HDQ95_11285 [Roseburia sp.]|nr:hypothetical protein [Roseburia sp.]